MDLSDHYNYADSSDSTLLSHNSYPVLEARETDIPKEIKKLIKFYNSLSSILFLVGICRLFSIKPFLSIINILLSMFCLSCEKTTSNTSLFIISAFCYLLGTEETLTFINKCSLVSISGMEIYTTKEINNYKKSDLIPMSKNSNTKGIQIETSDILYELIITLLTGILLLWIGFIGWEMYERNWDLQESYINNTINRINILTHSNEIHNDINSSSSLTNNGFVPFTGNAFTLKTNFPVASKSTDILIPSESVDHDLEKANIKLKQ